MNFNKIRGGATPPIRLSYFGYVQTYQDRHILYRKQFNKMLGHEVYALQKDWTNEHASNLFIGHIINNIHKHALKENAMYDMVRAVNIVPIEVEE